MSHVTCHMSHVTCHMSGVTFQMSPVTCHLSPVANAIVICWTAGNLISPVKTFNSMLNVFGSIGKNKGTCQKKDAKGCEMKGIACDI